MAEIVFRRWIAVSWSRSKTPSGRLSLRPLVSPPATGRLVRPLGFASAGAAPLPCPSASSWSSVGSPFVGSGGVCVEVGRISVDGKVGIPR